MPATPTRALPKAGDFVYLPSSNMVGMVVETASTTATIAQGLKVQQICGSMADLPVSNDYVIVDEHTITRFIRKCFMPRLLPAMKPALDDPDFTLAIIMMSAGDYSRGYFAGLSEKTKEQMLAVFNQVAHDGLHGENFVARRAVAYTVIFAEQPPQFA